MARYFFDVHDGVWSRDNTGTEYATVEEAYREAKRLLPDIARHEVPNGGHQHIYTVLVTNEEAVPIYTASLSFAGLPLTS
ncbi:DUF6894 family protein [Methylobacterium planeticum]|uniref:DUF6894 domain-containing protein n=1 Tax=Methylobacterium planeticum TaxID=2615211 RepID=A0A6N6MNV3_9HYPH|nr:hypothetical protein [Methylobacterium planeticum]KAB1070820.1 hypothetical protein F6X51_21050 [Methylobacterium planeticum]